MSWEFALASLCLALLPGPDILFVLAQSIGRGFRSAFAVSLGLVSGLAFHTAAVALGVAALVAASPRLLTVLRYLGAAYLVWLGLSALGIGRKKQPSKNQPAAAEKAISFAQFYRRGIIMNLLNPKVILFFLSFFPGFVPPQTVHVGAYVVGLGAMFAGITLCVFTAVAGLGGWLNRRFNIARFSASRSFAWITAVLFWAIAVWIAWL